MGIADDGGHPGAGVVCANTERAALRNHRAAYRVRHCGDLKGRIAQARQSLRLTFAHAEAFAAEAEKMLATPMKEREFGDFLTRLMPLAPTAGTTARRTHAESMAQLQAIFANDPTLQGIERTRWGAYNTITRYLDHRVRVRGKRDAQLVRAERALLGEHGDTKTKQEAFALLAAV